MADSVFTKIIQGEIPSHKVYEDSTTYAFLDIHPIQPGHVLVIPKRQVEYLWDLEEKEYQAVMHTARLVARRLRDVLKVHFVGVQVIGVDVPHAHIHLVPFNEASEYRNKPDMTAEADHKKLAELAQRLAL